MWTAVLDMYVNITDAAERPRCMDSWDTIQAYKIAM